MLLNVSEEFHAIPRGLTVTWLKQFVKRKHYGNKQKDLMKLDDMALKEKFRKERQRIKNWIRLERTLYFNDLANNAFSNPKLFWSFFLFKTPANRLPNTMIYIKESAFLTTQKMLNRLNTSSILCIQITLLV